MVNLSEKTKLRKVMCLLCKKKYQQITQTHLNSKHYGMSISNYLKLDGAVIRHNRIINTVCTKCGTSIQRFKLHKRNLCKECKRIELNERKRQKRLLIDPISKQKRNARFYGSLSERDIKMLNRSPDENNNGIDWTHATWDFVPGKRGYGKNDLGFEQIGSVSEDDFTIIPVYNKFTQVIELRIKGAYKLERQKNKTTT